MAARTIREFVPAGSAEAALADAGTADRIQWGMYRSCHQPSPIKAADDAMCATYKQQWAARKYSERQRILKRCFVRYYTANAAQRLMRTFVADKKPLGKLKGAPRHNPEPVRKLSPDQKAACHLWLTQERWKDDCEPPRRHCVAEGRMPTHQASQVGQAKQPRDWCIAGREHKLHMPALSSDGDAAPIGIAAAVD